MILDGLLFKITENNVGEMDTVLCIPTSKVQVLLEMYHSTVMGGHVGIRNVAKQLEILLPQFSRATKSIHNQMPCVSAVQER